jgi:hypothetical protein
VETPRDLPDTCFVRGDELGDGVLRGGVWRIDARHVDADAPKVPE